MNDIEYLHPILQMVVEKKRELGLTVHLPNLSEPIDGACIEYVNVILDAVIAIHREGKKEEYGDLHLFFEVFGDEEQARAEWYAFCHNVSGCHPRVLLYCERVLIEAGKTLPKRPPTLQLQLVAAE